MHHEVAGAIPAGFSPSGGAIHRAKSHCGWNQGLMQGVLRRIVLHQQAGVLHASAETISADAQGRQTPVEHACPASCVARDGSRFSRVGPSPAALKCAGRVVHLSLATAPGVRVRALPGARRRLTAAPREQPRIALDETPFLAPRWRRRLPRAGSNWERHRASCEHPGREGGPRSSPSGLRRRSAHCRNACARSA